MSAAAASRAITVAANKIMNMRCSIMLLFTHEVIQAGGFWPQGAAKQREAQKFLSKIYNYKVGILLVKQCAYNSRLFWILHDP